MKLAIVTAYPPSKVTLTEYGYYLVKHFRLHDEIDEIVLMTDKTTASKDLNFQEDGCKISVEECWDFNSYTNVLRVNKAISKHRPDAILFNLQFLKFGDKKIPAALGLLLPYLCKKRGIPTISLLHNILEKVDLSNAGFTDNKLLQYVYNFIGTNLTKFILASDIVAVTISKYVSTLEKKYRAKNIALIPHGSFETPPTPDFNLPSGPKQVMAFGKFGTYKKVEVLMMNVWIQLSEAPIQYSEEKGWESVLDNPKLNLPLFFINTPSLYRCFISNCNFLTYLSPASPDGNDEKTFANEDCELNCNTPPPLVLTSAQFLNTTAVTDHFLQMCSFSCREFGAPNPEYKSLQIIRGDKISIANCQFSGKVDFQCTKVAALGCYFLGTGIMPTYLKKIFSPTTHALEMRPPPWYKDASVNKKNGYNGILTGPRLIISGCQFVTHTHEIYNYEDINKEIIKLPFTWILWEESKVINNLKNIGIDQINVQFDTTTFYMVSPKDENKKDFSKGFNFKALILQNLPLEINLLGNFNNVGGSQFI